MSDDDDAESAIFRSITRAHLIIICINSLNGSTLMLKKEAGGDDELVSRYAGFVHNELGGSCNNHSDLFEATVGYKLLLH